MHTTRFGLLDAPVCSLSMVAAQVRVRSFANRNQLAADPRDRAEQLLEWERHYLTVLGTANQRLYSFRLQTASKTYDAAKARPWLPGAPCMRAWLPRCDRALRCNARVFVCGDRDTSCGTECYVKHMRADSMCCCAVRRTA